MIFPDRDAPKTSRMGTLFIPNTLSIIKGSPNPEGAKKLVDYLLSAEVEAKLAEAASHQIPLNPNVKVVLPEGMETPKTVKAMEVDFGKAADLTAEVAAFLHECASPGVLFDVGANNGLFSLLFCRLDPLNRAIGYEPSPIFADRAEVRR